MLTFKKHPDFYRVTETTMSATKDNVMTVDYSLDLSLKRCNNESYRETTEADRNWFEKHYRKKFK
jgi:hypothetical protein